MKSTCKDITAQIKSAIQAIDPRAEVHLFGSRARGDSKIDSDWDILVLVEKNVDRLQDQEPYRRAILGVMTRTDELISTIVRNKQQWNTFHRDEPLFKEIEEEGILL